MADFKVCSVPDCDKRPLARGYCSAHYGAFRRKTYLTGTCSIPACDKPAEKRGWCGAHYFRWYKHGDPLAGGTPWGGPEQYFREVVLPYSGAGCLTWPYTLSSNGYGQIRRNGRLYRVPRLVCEHVHGPAPSRKHHAAHTCGKGHEGCVSPQHLEWKTPVGNAADKLLHGTSNRGERSAAAKLTEEDVRTMRGLAGLMSNREIAQQFGISPRQVRDIHKRKCWGWLD